MLNYPISLEAVIITYSLHIYHIINYFNKLIFDDWLHHILMCLFALPLCIIIDCGSLTGYSLFFLTGLPGGIDYFLLFLVKNNIINKFTEKKINRYLNLWIRCPGCISFTTIGILTTINNYDILINKNKNKYVLYFILISNFLVYWNGLYYMSRVLENYVINKKLKN